MTEYFLRHSASGEYATATRDSTIGGSGIYRLEIDFVNPDGAQYQKTIYNVGDSASGLRLHFQFLGSNGITCYFIPPTGTSSYITTQYAISRGVRYLYAFEINFDTGDFTSYVDGVPINTGNRVDLIGLTISPEIQFGSGNTKLDLYGLRESVNNTLISDYNPSLSNGLGTTLTDSLGNGSTDATLINFGAFPWIAIGKGVTTYEVNPESAVSQYLRAAVIPTERNGNTLREIVTNKTFTPAEDLVWNDDLSLQGNTKAKYTNIGQTSFDLSQDDLIITFEQEQLGSGGNGDDVLISMGATSGSNGEGCSIKNRDWVKGYNFSLRARSYVQIHDLSRQDIGTYSYPRTVVTVHYSPSLNKLDIYENGVLLYTEPRLSTAPIDGTSKIYNINYGVPTGSARNWGTLLYTKDNATFTAEEVAEIVAKPYGAVTEIAKANDLINDDIAALDYGLKTDSSGGYVSLPHIGQLASDPFEVVIEYTPTTTPTYGGVFSIGGSNRIVYQYGNSTISFVIHNKGFQTVDLTTLGTLGQRLKLTYIYDGTDAIYRVDNLVTGLFQEIIEPAVSPPNTNTPTMILGSTGTSSESVFHYLKYKRLTDVRYYDFNRKSGTEVPELYYGAKNGTLNNFPLDPHTDENSILLTTSGWHPVPQTFYRECGAGKEYLSLHTAISGLSNTPHIALKIMVFGNVDGGGMYLHNNTGTPAYYHIIASPDTYFDGTFDGIYHKKDITGDTGGWVRLYKPDIYVVAEGLKMLGTPIQVSSGRGFNSLSFINCFANGNYISGGPGPLGCPKFPSVVRNCVITGFNTSLIGNSRTGYEFYYNNIIINVGGTYSSYKTFNSVSESESAKNNIVIFDENAYNGGSASFNTGYGDDNFTSDGAGTSTLLDFTDAFEDIEIKDYRIKKSFADTYLIGTGVGGSDIASWSWVAGIDPLLWSDFHTLTENAATPALGSALTTVITEANLPADIWDVAEPSENYLRFDDSLDSYVEITDIPLTMDYEIVVDFSFTAGAELDLYRIVCVGGGWIGLFQGKFIYFLNGAGVDIRSGGGPVDGVRYVLRGTCVGGSVSFYVNDTLIGSGAHTSAPSVESFGFIQRGRLKGDFYRCDISIGGSLAHSYNPSASNETTLVDTVGGNNGTLVNFLASGNYGLAKNGGGDLRVCRHEDGASLIPLEVVKWDSINKKAVLWSRVPNFKTGEKVTVFYGKAGEVQPAVDAPFGRNRVWRDYAAVWHGELGKDSVGNSVATVGSPFQVEGRIGSGADFGTGSDAWYENIAVTPQSITGQTLSVWLNTDSTAGNRNAIGHGTTRLQVDNGQLEVEVTTTPTSSTLFGGAVVNGVWTQVHMTATNSGDLILYQDGAFVGSLPLNGALNNLPSEFTVGRRGFLGEYFDGRLDEATLQTRALSADYIAAEYANQSSPATFWSSGAVSADIDLTGFFNSVSSLAGSLEKQSTLAAQSNTYGTFDDSLSKLSTVSGSLSATVSLDGYPSKVTPFADSFSVTSDTTGTFGKVADFTDSFSLASDTTGLFSKVANMVGTSYSTFTLDGLVFALDPTVFLNGVTSMQSFTAGNITKIGRMAGTTSLIFDANGTLRKAGNLTGSLAVQSIVDSAIAKASLLSGAINTESSVLSSLEKTVILLGEINSNASLSGESQKQALLYGDLSFFADTDGAFVNDAGVVSVIAISIEGELLLNTVIGVGSQISYIDVEMDSIDIVIDAKIKPTIGSL